MKTLSPELIHQYFHTGWIVQEDVFNSEEIKKIKKCYEDILQIARELKSTQMYQNSYFVLGERNDQTIVKRVVWACGVAPYLKEIARDPRLTGPVSQLLDSREFDQLLCQAHFKIPQDGLVFAWHQDIQHRDKGPGTWTDIDGKGSYVQTALVIDDMHEDNGPLIFVPESSQWGKVDFGDHDYDKPSFQQKYPSQFDPKNTVTISAKAGSVLYFGPYTAHASFENCSKESSRVLINGYAYPGANHRNYPGSGLGEKIILE
jgi:ectoine hydroxylase-related dioxygenase (phytanoyl-CoA dioxygenase family)